MFLYNGEPFKQIKGGAMGSFLESTLMNFFLANLENKLLNNDDNLSITKFLNLLNKQHSNMQFTMKKSVQALPFLDVHVQI